MIERKEKEVNELTKGKRRHQPPKGYTTATVAIQRIGKMLYKHVKEGRVQKAMLPGSKTVGFYRIEDIERIERAEETYSEATKGTSLHSTDAIFTYATLGDMDALYACAKTFFPNPASAEIRRAWMRKEPRGHYLVKRVEDGAVVAYLYLLALKPEYLAAYMHGELAGRMITPDHIERFEPGKPITCIVNAIQSDQNVEQKLRSNYVAMLLRGVRQDLGMLGKEGITIPYLYAWSESTEGIALCTKLGMQHWEEPKGKRCYFMLDMQETHASIIRDYKRGIAEWRQAHQSILHSMQDTPTTIKPVATRTSSGYRSQIEPSQNQVKSTIPDGYQLVRHFNKAHNLKDTTVLRRITAGVITITPGEWQHGRQRVTQVLSPEQQRDYWQSLHTEPGFTACPSCPHRIE